MSEWNPCLSCGACCASFRVSFHWSETDSNRIDGVPAELTVEVDPHRNAMLGTLTHPPRCIALAGEVGATVHCLIYGQRPDVCRVLQPSYRDGARSEKCDQARSRHGFRLLTPADWEVTTRPPEDVPTLPRAA